MRKRFYFTTAAFPNMITLLNLVAGFFSILMSVQEKYEYAVWLVFLALILDSLDGHVARIFGNETEFGRELDSLADAVSFVVAPCMFVYMAFFQNSPMALLLVIVFYLCSGIFRLARFNVNPTHGGCFEGLPTPAAALTLIMTLLAFHKSPWADRSFSMISVVFLMTALGFLMVSDIPYPKVSAIKFRTWRTLFVVQVVTFFVAFFYLNIESAIASIFLTFIVLSPFYCVSFHKASGENIPEEGGA
ncbi:MAG: CDP-diacylglycerol--serine O-phosphatidyltransferase [Candidatus Omnitrophica bacterium]|nr:CDP-diacylglycerol--serine O-phosphatidyltransferase [Candidatus Omnitrophota bacterium]